MQYLSVGIIERSIIGSTVWCCNLLFSPQGILLSKHRKLQPTAAERVVWSQGEGTYTITSSSSSTANASTGQTGHATQPFESDKGSLNLTNQAGNSVRDDRSQAVKRGKGDNLPVAQTEFGKIGGLICWESKSKQISLCSHYRLIL